MPTYEQWELQNAGYYLKRKLQAQYPSKILSVEEVSFEKTPKSFTPVIVLVVKAKELHLIINQMGINFKIEKMAGINDRYCCRVEKVDDIENLIGLANNEACQMLNTQLECVHPEGTSQWQVFPPGKPITSEIPHLRCYPKEADPILAKACLTEVMEKMTGCLVSNHGEFKENKKISCLSLGGYLSLVKKADGTYYLYYQKFNLEKLTAKPLILYLFSSLEELSANSVPILRH